MSNIPWVKIHLISMTCMRCVLHFTEFFSYMNSRTEFMGAPEWDWHDAFPQRLSTSSGVIRNIIILASPGTDLVDFKGAFVLASRETQLLKYQVLEVL